MELRSYESETHELKEQIGKHSQTIEKLRKVIREKTKLLAQSNAQLETAFKEGEDIIGLQSKLEQQEDTIRKILQECDIYRRQAEQLDRINRFARLQEEACIRNLSVLVKKNTRPTEKDWSEIVATVEKYYPQIAGIRFNDKISDLDYKICVLIKAKMNLYGIMVLTGKNNSYLSTARKRLFEKIHHTKGSAKDFDNYIQQL